MSYLKQYFILCCLMAIGLAVMGCNESSTTPSTTGKTNTGLFKNAGTFSFSSNKGDFTANGIFDTLMMNGNASGAFYYTKDNKDHILVAAYNVVSPTKVQLVFTDIIDGLDALSTGMYTIFPFSNQNKAATFIYVPNVLDTSRTAAFYVLTSGSMNVITLSETGISGSFSGSGMSIFDTTQTITVSNGSFNTPLVEYYYSPDDDMAMSIQEKVMTEMRNKLQAR